MFTLIHKNFNYVAYESMAATLFRMHELVQRLPLVDIHCHLFMNEFLSSFWMLLSTQTRSAETDYSILLLVVVLENKRLGLCSFAWDFCRRNQLSGFPNVTLAMLWLQEKVPLFPWDCLRQSLECWLSPETAPSSKLKLGSYITLIHQTLE